MFWRRGTTSAGASKKPKPPGRKRIAAGWVLLAFGLLVTGVWGASRWWDVRVARSLSAEGGFVRWVAVTEASPGDQVGKWEWVFSLDAARERSWVWWLTDMSHSGLEVRQLTYAGIGAYADVAVSDRFRCSVYIVLLWPFALVSLLGGGWLVWAGQRVKHRAEMGRCRTCGYDLAGLAAVAMCPECGKEQARGEEASRRTG